MKNIKRILITGVAGLIGTHLSRYFLDKGYEISGIDDLSGGYKENIDDRLIKSMKFAEINLIDSKALEGAFKELKPDFVYHLAAYAAEGLSPFIRNYNYTNNILASVNVINECIKNDVQKMVFTSSMAVYGIGIPPFTEDQPLSPIDPYGIAKYSVEQDLKQAYNQFGLKYTIIRPHNIIGIYQNIWDKYRNVIGIWIHNILNNQPILIYGDGLQRRAFSDIKYYMEPFEKVMNNFNGEIFNIGADQDYSILEIALLLKDISGKHGYECFIEHREPRHEVSVAYCDHTKAKDLLNFKDDTILRDLIEKMFMWAKDQPERSVKIMNYELDKGIYSYWK